MTKSSVNVEKFAQQIQDMLRRLADLQRRADESPLQQQELLAAGYYEELQTALEKLQIAEEELRQQNEELVTARQTAEAERHRYQELFEFAPDGYLVTDTEGTLWEANRAAAGLLNVSQHFLVGKPLIIFVTQDERHIFHSQLRALQQAERLQEWAVRLCPRNSEPFDAALTVAAVRNGEGKPIALRWLLRDITKRKQAEEALRQQIEREQALNSDLERRVQERTVELQQKIQELEQLNILKDDFLSTVSHELRTPLANMKMAIQMLKTAPSPERQQRYLEILQAECNRETELVNDLLDLQRLEAASYPVLLSESINLQEWLPRIIEPFRSRALARKHSLELDISPDVPPIISDCAGLERILVELLNNACKYTHAGGEVILRVRDHPDREPPVTIFTVSNQAEIPAAALSRIFEKFYRVPNADPWKQGGTGLGLALVQKLVEHLGGTIHVESGGGWTTFTVQLPSYQARG